MSRYRRVVVEGGSYFFTVVTERRQPILTDPAIRSALRQAIDYVRRDYPFVIDGWVLLPDHLHTIWTLPEGDADYSTRWRLIKTRVTKACAHLYARPKFLTTRRATKRCGTIWQHRFWEHLLRDDADFNHHMDYLHMNPVKHGLVKQVRDWPYSSFHRLVNMGIYPRDWAAAL
ncbi:MAG TPA: transposase [Cellvibrionaceae bacterium]